MHVHDVTFFTFTSILPQNAFCFLNAKRPTVSVILRNTLVLYNNYKKCYFSAKLAWE